MFKQDKEVWVKEEYRCTISYMNGISNLSRMSPGIMVSDFFYNYVVENLNRINLIRIIAEYYCPNHRLMSNIRDVTNQLSDIVFTLNDFRRRVPKSQRVFSLN